MRCWALVDAEAEMEVSVAIQTHLQIGLLSKLYLNVNYLHLCSYPGYLRVGRLGHQTRQNQLIKKG